MQLPRRRRQDFSPEEPADYPQHLRDALVGLPAAAGVYVFHGREGGAPLYVGKSVNLRSRVLAHLRNPDEARMLRQTERISHMRTAGELGALLLEAQCIKQMRPLYNQKLRDNRELCSLRWRGGPPEVVYSRELDFAQTPDLYGLFSSRRAALDALRDLADRQMLCYGLLGLEKLSPGRGCFRAAIRQCAGACCGRESNDAHARRLADGLLEWQVQRWPWAGPVGLVERDGGLMQIHVVTQWHYLGSAASLSEAQALAAGAARFDADAYRILLRPVMTQAVEVLPLA